MSQYGYLNSQGTWSCNYPGCTSRAVFTRGCDLRKHHKRHTKSFFCRFPGCSQSTGGGFSSKKDLARHEAKHNPGVICEWDGCDRIFSRVDNMVCFPPQTIHDQETNNYQRGTMSREYTSKEQSVQQRLDKSLSLRNNDGLAAPKRDTISKPLNDTQDSQTRILGYSSKHLYEEVTRWKFSPLIARCMLPHSEAFVALCISRSNTTYSVYMMINS
jgi:hypothetical protein